MLVEVVGFVVLINDTQPRFLTNYAGPPFPDALWSEKGLVIEADRQEFRETFYQRIAVSVQAAAVVLTTYLHVGHDGFAVGQHVRVCRQLHQSVCILSGHGQNTARPMIFERTAQQPLSVSGQCAGDAVTGNALVTLVLKAERNAVVAVQQ